MAKKQNKETQNSPKEEMMVNKLRSLNEIGDSVEVEGYKESFRQTIAKVKKEKGWKFSIQIKNEKKVTAVIKRES